MVGPTKYQRIRVALLRQQGGTLVIGKQNQGKQELLRLVQHMVDIREGLEFIQETPTLVMYRFHPQKP